MSAGSAASADLLDGHDSSYFLNRSTFVPIPRFTLGAGQVTGEGGVPPMWSYGPFTFTARCFIGLGVPPGDEAEVLISTTQAHSAFEGFASDADLNPGDPEISRSVVAVDGEPGLPQFESSADGTAIAPDGTEIRSIVFWAGVNIFHKPGTCSFGGFAVV